MQIGLECIPCFVRQAFEVGSLGTRDQKIREGILREVLSKLTDQSFERTSPSVGRDIHRIITLLSGDIDPYLEIKKRPNELARRLMPSLKELVRGSADPFETAVRLAIAGNIIDCGQGDRAAEETTASPSVSLIAGLEISSLRNAPDLRRSEWLQMLIYLFQRYRGAKKSYGRGRDKNRRSRKSKGHDGGPGCGDKGKT